MAIRSWKAVNMLSGLLENQENKKVMNKPSGITIVESRVRVPERLLEEHVNSLHHPQECIQPRKSYHIFSRNYESLYWCTEELAIGGTVILHLSNPRLHCISIPVSTSLMVLCTRKGEAQYKLNWVCSLS